MVKRIVVGDEDVVWIDHEGVKTKTPKAKLFSIHGEEKWIPKSVIIDEGDAQAGLKKWFAERNSIEGDW